MKKVYENGTKTSHQDNAFTNGLFRLVVQNNPEMGSGIGVALWYCDNTSHWRELRSFDAGWVANLADVAGEVRGLLKVYNEGYADLTFDEFVTKMGS